MKEINKKALKFAHLVRYKNDSILVGKNTFEDDLPLLNCRIKGLNNFKPDLVIIDRKLRLKKNLALYSLAKKRKTYLLTTSNNSKQTSFLKKRNILDLELTQLKI